MAAGETSKLAYHERERQSRKAFERVVGRHVSVREFRRIRAERGWKLPPAHGVEAARLEHMTAKRTAAEAAERKFLAEGLDRPERAEADYYRSHY
jgi:hypothetical protein